MGKLSGVELDLDGYKILLQFSGRKEPLVIHFDTPSRRFYFSLIALIVSEMKKQPEPGFIYIRKYENILRQLDIALSGKHTSKDVEKIWVKINIAWRHRLPDLEEAALFKVLDRKRISPYEKGGKYRYKCSDVECDTWANLFGYDENNKWRLKFAVDSIPLSLNNISITLGDLKDKFAWQAFVKSLRIHPKTIRKEKKSLARRWKKIAFSLALALLIGAVALAIYNSYLRPSPPVSPMTELKLLYKPSIAVLPFANLSNDPQHEYFSDGLTEEIITTLSKVKQLFVIASNSTFTYKGQPVKIQQVGKELGVRYVLEGSVRWSDDRVRISVQLIDATTGHHLWAESYDRKLSDIFTVQDDVSKEIFSALDVKLTQGEQSRLFKKGTDNLQVYLKLLEGFYYLQNTNPENNHKAKQIFQDVISQEPGYVCAYVLLARTHLLDIYLGTTKSKEASYKKIVDLAEKALEIDPSQGLPYALLGTAYTVRREWEKGIEFSRRAVELSPNVAFSYFCHGVALTFDMRPTEAILVLQKAMKLNPIPPPQYLNIIAVNYRILGQYNKAIDYLEKTVSSHPDHLFSLINLSACYVLAGREEEAYIVSEKVLQLYPNFSYDKFAQTVPLKSMEEEKKFYTALKKAFSSQRRKSSL